ncbi:MAG: cyclic nucleotide-binding domain-containing protein [Burkholderiales bacterium]|nr:cyclic nucleotide-binding domain-containing protein [Burkholderiales bacterium]MDE1926604.1 cyclic nucleotide-binding domain-containing protein [Burkholderiales bacterium]MDE2160243.1 cyclic nucleotide-binding domain-containing protein [Burkholderiales bacterium]MDE2503355.1 cyclic nucleotide-binding domain-containing protein [Burkholderiales bacterium]
MIPSIDRSRHAGAAAALRPRSLSETPELVERAVELLRTPALLGAMDTPDLLRVASFLRLVSFRAGTRLFEEGDSSNTSYLLLLLSGEVQVVVSPVAGGDPIDLSVLGPGDVLGEMGLLDGAPRSTTCTALAPVQAAVLTRGALEQLLEENPRVAAKLMIALAKRMADRLRALGEQIGIYASIASAATSAPTN